MEEKILQRIKQLQAEIYKDNMYRDLPKVTMPEAWSMACQALQVEYAGKQAVYLCGIQMLLTNVLRDRETSELKFPI